MAMSIEDRINRHVDKGPHYEEATRGPVDETRTEYLWVANEDDVGIEQPAYPVALGRTREEAADKWYEYAIQDAQSTFGESSGEYDPEMLERSFQAINLLHTELYAGSDCAFCEDNEKRVSLHQVEIPTWVMVNNG